MPVETHVDIVAKRLPALAALTREKIGLSLAEAEILSGWSRASLYRAIASKRLRMTGRAILRTDLETFLQSERELLERLERAP